MGLWRITLIVSAIITIIIVKIFASFIKVHATFVNAIDMIFRCGATLMYGLTKLKAGLKKPNAKILEFDASGEVIALGKEVTKFNKCNLVYLT